MAVDSSSLLATQAPPDMLLGSEEGEKKASPTACATDVTLSGPSPIETTPDVTKDSEQVSEKEGTTDGGDGHVVVKKEESIEKEPQVESSAENADEADPTSASADSEAVEAMETDSANQAGAGDSGDAGDQKSGAGDSEPSADGNENATVSSESQQPPLADSAMSKDTVASEGGEVVEETAKGGEQVNIQEGPSEVEEEKRSGDAVEAPKEEDEGAVSSSPHGEEPVISEPVVKGESVEEEGGGEGTTQEGEEQQQQVCTCIYMTLYNYNNGDRD